MRIGFFGKLGESIARSVELDVPPSIGTVADLRRWLAGLFPQAAAELSGPSARACVDDQIVDEDHLINDCKSVEFFPPLSGG